ncbi:acyltransferase [Oceanidesulfovibrio marinus]|uniref:Acyltransferase n=1 Tax=Oceanidesulfovibrio marinus TaxID=370038 RepID=A0ABX6NIK2_9BACT|nr:acyltransferase [Oceanidesulfovibrio marinus]
MRKRIFYLDVVRSIALTMVIAIHYNLNMTIHNLDTAARIPFITQLNGHGAIVQSLFVILSGAALMLVYGKREKSIHLGEYAKKRILSIYPLFWVTYIILFVFMTVYKGHTPFRGIHTWRYIYTVTAFDGWLLPIQQTPYMIGEWFLGFIIILYCLFPLLLAIYRRSPAGMMIFAFLVACIPALYEPARLGMSLYTSPMARLFEFAFGMLFIMHYEDGVSAKQGVVAAVLLALLYNVPNGPWNFPLNVVMGILWFSVISWVSRYLEKSAVIRNFFFWTSLYSYGAFLFHHYFLQFYLPRYGIAPQTLGGFFLYGMVLIIAIYGVGYLLTKLTGVLVKQILHMKPSRSRERLAGEG